MPTVTRRRLLGTSSAGLVAATLPGLFTSQAGAEAQQRPNFLWFFSEDNNPYVGAYGDRLARTPTIDQLARDGVLFEIAYSPAPVCAPSRFTYLTGVHAESAGPAHHMRATAALPDFVKGFPEYLREAGYYCTNNSKTDYNADVDMAATWDASSGQAHWRNRPAGAPFFAQFNNQTTHESRLFKVTGGAVQPEDVAVPPFLPDTPEIRADQASYHNLMEIMDGQLAARLQELQDAGVAEDTIVFYAGDNGGALPFSKRFSGERGHRIPLIVRIPEKWSHLAATQPGQRVASPVQGVDYAPTVLSLAGVNVPGHMQGRAILGPARQPQRFAFGQRSRMDERYDLQRTARSEHYVYTRNYLPWRPYGQYMAYMWQQRGYQVWQQRHLGGTLTEVQERFWRPKPFEELYDVRADTHQLNNLATDPRHRGILEQHRHALDEHLLATNDNGFIPEDHPLEGWAESRRPGAYPLGRVLEVAGVAARRDPTTVPRLLHWLDDDNDVIRFWAANGAVGLGAALAHQRGELEARFDAEPSVHVRIPLAEALAALGSTEHVDQLAEVLDTNSSPRIRLQALNALTYVDLAAVRPHRAVVQRAADSGDEYLKNAGRYLGAVLDGTFDPSITLY